MTPQAWQNKKQTHPEPAGPAIAGAFGEQIPGSHVRPECRGSTIVEASTMTPQAWQNKKQTQKHKAETLAEVQSHEKIVSHFSQEIKRKY